MRSSILFALIIGLFLVLGPAPRAGAVPSAFHLVLLNAAEYECEGESGGPLPRLGIVDGECTDIPAQSVLKFAITLDVDEAGANAWAIDLRWDTDLQNSLELVGQTANASYHFPNPSPPPATIGYTAAPNTPGAVQQSTAGESGFAAQVSSGVTQDFNLTVSSTSFRTSTVTFRSHRESTATELTLGFFRTDGSSMGNSASQFVTPNFGAFSINAPEPSGTLLALASLSSVAFLASRRRRSD